VIQSQMIYYRNVKKDFFFTINMNLLTIYVTKTYDVVRSYSHTSLLQDYMIKYETKKNNFFRVYIRINNFGVGFGKT